MVMNHSRTPRLKPLLDALPPGFVVDAAWLKARGIDPKSIHDYVAKGWVERVVRGVYRRPPPNGAQLKTNGLGKWFSCRCSTSRVQCASRWITKRSRPIRPCPLPHVCRNAARSSLSATRLHGSNACRQRNRSFRIDSACSAAIQRVSTTQTPWNYESGWTTNVWRWPIRASCPERAILEAIDELPGNASFEELDRVFERLGGPAA